MSKIMKREYNPDTLKKLQKIEVEILKDFIAICEKHDINYFVIAGTAIGTAREKGMIPWDDDIDIGLLREDYLKLLKIYKKEFSDKYTLISPDAEDKYYNLVPIMSLNGSKLIVEPADKMYEPGIFMDLFIFENIPDDAIEAEKHMKKCMFLRNLYVASRSNLSYIKDESMNQKLKYYFSLILRLFARCFDKNGNILYQYYYNLATKYYGKTNTYTILSDPYSKLNCITRNEIFPLRKMKFGEMEVNMVNKYHDYLTRRFGEYMEIPPLEKRTNHSPVVLVFPEKK